MLAKRLTIWKEKMKLSAQKLGTSFCWLRKPACQARGRMPRSSRLDAEPPGICVLKTPPPCRQRRMIAERTGCTQGGGRFEPRGVPRRRNAIPVGNETKMAGVPGFPRPLRGRSRPSAQAPSGRRLRTCRRHVLRAASDLTVRIPATCRGDGMQSQLGIRRKWLGYQDSNLDSWHQKPESCRWTIPQLQRTR